MNARIKELYQKGALHIILGTFALKFVAFFGSIVVVRLLTKNDYGLLGYVESVCGYAFVFAGFGLLNGLFRYMIIAKNKIEQKQYFMFIIKNSFLINIGISLILCMSALWFLKIPDNYASARGLLIIMSLLAPFQNLLDEILCTLRTFFENKLYAYGTFLSSALLIVGRIIGAWIGGVNGVVWSRIILNVAFAIWGLIFVYNRFIIKDTVPRLERAKQKQVMAFSIQYMITNGFWAIFMLNGSFLIGTLLNDPSGLADYRAASAIPSGISIFAGAIGIFVSPYFTKNEKDKAWVRKNYKRVYIVSALITGGMTLSLAILVKPLILFVYGERYLNIVSLMRVFLLAAFCNSGLRFTTANLLACMGEIKYNMFTSAGGIIAQLILDLVLIPRLGVMGAAIVDCIVYLFMATVLFVIFYRKFYLCSSS